MIQVIYGRSFYSEDKWDALAFTAAHIKAIDGITANPNILPSKAENPTFPTNPYTIIMRVELPLVL